MINPEVTVLHAKGLQTAAHRLLESQPDVGCTIGAFVLLGIAAELVLKALRYREAGKYRTDHTGHDLYLLFQDLERGESKDWIECVQSAYGISVEEVLGEHRDVLQWRYVMEQDKSLHCNPTKLSRALDALFHAAELTFK